MNTFENEGESTANTQNEPGNDNFKKSKSKSANINGRSTYKKPNFFQRIFCCTPGENGDIRDT